MKNEKIMDAVRMLRQMCAEQTDCARCPFGRGNGTCKITGIPQSWDSDFGDDHSAGTGKKGGNRWDEIGKAVDSIFGTLTGTPTDAPTDTVAPTDAPTASGKTRQERFLELFPRADAHTGVLEVCPGDIDMRFTCHEPKDCADCKKEYWLAAEKEDSHD